MLKSYCPTAPDTAPARGSVQDCVYDMLRIQGADVHYSCFVGFGGVRALHDDKITTGGDPKWQVP